MGVTPPVVPPYVTRISSTPPSGPIGRLDPWTNEATPFRDATSGRSYHSRLVDAEIMNNEDEPVDNGYHR